MAKIKTVSGLKELDNLLDSLVDPKFRRTALRTAARKTLTPVKAVLQSKLPDGGEDESSYSHYNNGQGYKSGDLRNGVKISISVNTDKKIKTKSDGYAKDKQSAELVAEVTFKKPLIKLAMILENGRSKRVATTRNGKQFHTFGKPTDYVKRDIGVTQGMHFVSSTAAECEASMVTDFSRELTLSISKQVKKMEKKNGK